MKNFFAILGGMGTLTTTNFLVELNKKHNPKKDQDFFNYILFNHAEIPDRTAYILDHSTPSPLPALIEDIEKINLLQPDFIVMPCNTAHYFIDDLKEATSIPIIDMIKETVKAIPFPAHSKKKIGLAVTQGTLESQLYQLELLSKGYEVILPDLIQQNKINQLIYTFIKEQGIINLLLYEEILEDFKLMGSDVTLLGCTELSLANSHDPLKRFPVIDAEKILIDKTFQLAQELKVRDNKALINSDIV
ncbi:amino acid racemase [Carnobacterium pleistocenium]|uniref:amino acid racemase n=1 Tax=Carnobacterium pleistocenium TaxID=181073 RepID=UPI0005547BC5|nr:amino acid racemase [Carnobacterium pleistocenium]